MEENEEMEKEGGNEERMRKCRNSIALHFLLISSFSLHFLTARMPGCHNLCNPVTMTNTSTDCETVGCYNDKHKYTL